MIVLKSKEELNIMRRANVHVAEILDILENSIKPGVSTWDLDKIAHEELKKRHLKSPFLGYHGYPAVLCSSVNHVIVHGIPSKKDILCDGDIIGIDFGVICDGYVGDSARTIAVGSVSPEAQEIVTVTKKCLELAIEQCKVGNCIRDIGRVISDYVNPLGFGIVRDFVGHGIGVQMHEEPQVPNYYSKNSSLKMKEGLVIAIEPMINRGTHEVKVLSDGWTAVTLDGSLSAHFEHSVAILEDGPWVLSRI